MTGPTFRLELGLDQANVLRDALDVFRTVQVEEAVEAHSKGDHNAYLEATRMVMVIEQIERQMGVHRDKSHPDGKPPAA